MRTPEQKAWFEYGHARRKTYEAKEMLAYDRLAKKHGKLKNAQNVLSCGKHMLKAAIYEAWQKRAVCRRTCRQCSFYDQKANGVCYNLLKSVFIADIKHAVNCSCFDPRKEGE